MLAMSESSRTALQEPRRESCGDGSEMASGNC